MFYFVIDCVDKGRHSLSGKIGSIKPEQQNRSDEQYEQLQIHHWRVISYHLKLFCEIGTLYKISGLTSNDRG